jgi:response regulator RpfG family c-di-GMP phosphodiesterase
MTKRILVVEDQEDNRQILRDLLLSSGYEILEAGDGLQAIEQAAKHRPDLILMDIQLPVLDGYESTRRIKADPDLNMIPIIRDFPCTERRRGEGACGRLRCVCGKALQPARATGKDARILMMMHGFEMPPCTIPHEF